MRAQVEEQTYRGLVLAAEDIQSSIVGVTLNVTVEQDSHVLLLVSKGPARYLRGLRHRCRVESLSNAVARASATSTPCQRKAETSVSRKSCGVHSIGR